jgi:hypothetical protein
MSISVELVRRSEGCERRRRSGDAPKARLSSIRIGALRYISTTAAAERVTGATNHAPERYRCNNMRVN